MKFLRNTRINFNDYNLSSHGHLTVATSTPDELDVTQSSKSPRIDRRNRIGASAGLAAFIGGYLLCGPGSIFANDTTNVNTTKSETVVTAPQKAGEDSTDVDTTDVDTTKAKLALPNEARQDTVVVTDTVRVNGRAFMQSNYPTHNVLATQVLLQPSMYRMVITPNGLTDVDSLFYTARDRLGEKVEFTVMPADKLLSNLAKFERDSLGNRGNVQALYRILIAEAKKHPASKLDIARLNEAGKDGVFNPRDPADSSLVQMIDDPSDVVVGFKFSTPSGSRASVETRYVKGDTLYHMDSSQVDLIDNSPSGSTRYVRYDTNKTVSPDTLKRTLRVKNILGESVPAIVRMQFSGNEFVPIEERLADPLIGHENYGILRDTVYNTTQRVDTVTTPADTVYQDGGVGKVAKYVGITLGSAAAAVGIGWLIKKIFGGKDSHGGSTERPGIY